MPIISLLAKEGEGKGILSVLAGGPPLLLGSTPPTPGISAPSDPFLSHGTELIIETY